MPTHDIIDNRHEKLADHINRILPSTEPKYIRQHNIRNWIDQSNLKEREDEIPRIICSEAFVD